MNGACGTHESEERYVQCLGG